MPRIIAIAGIPRSGTTWLYNAVRLIHLKANAPIYGAWCEDYEAANSSPTHMIKVHEPGQLNIASEKIFSTNRALVDSLASLIRMGWLDQSETRIRELAERYNRLQIYWAEKSLYTVNYNDIVADPMTVIRTLGVHVGIRLGDREINDISECLSQIDPPSSGSYDPITLLHPRHRNFENGKNIDTDKIKEFIRKTLTYA